MRDYKFDAKKVKNEIIDWIKQWFDENGKGCNAVIGISGGKDSSIVAALCVDALGKDRVIGVLMPCGKQHDIGDSEKLCKHLGINSYTINIGEATGCICSQIELCSHQTLVNLPPRIRMATLYAVSQSHNGRVANTCNLSEEYIGYSTRWGDSVGDFSPLASLTATEVIEIGKQLDLPIELVEKVPSDGLQELTDEQNFGFTYEILDKYIRIGICEDENIKAMIDFKHEKNLFKSQPIPCYKM